MLAPLFALAAAAAAQGTVSYTAALTLEEGGRLRAVETFRPVGEALCGELARELPLKRLGPDGLRRLAAVEVAGAYRGSGEGLRPAGWRLERTPRGARVVVAPAPAPPDCAVVLMTVGPAFLRPAPGGSRLRFVLPGAGLGAPLASAAVGLAGLGAPLRLVRLERGIETPLAAGTGSAVLPAAPAGVLVAEAELAEPPPPAAPERLLADNLHVAVGLAGLAAVILLYALGPRPRSHDGRPWGLLTAGGALSSGTVAAMRLAEDPAAVSNAAALKALGAGLAAGLAGAAVLALWGLVVVLVRSASRPGAPRPAVLHLAGAAAGFTAFGLTTGAADLFTRLVQDAAPAAALAGALHLLVHAAAFVLKRAPEDA